MLSKTQHFFIFTLLAAWIVYSGVDAWFGESGGQNLASLHESAERLRAEIDDLEARSKTLEDKTARLIGPEIDLELLDERVRAVLGYAHDRDKMLMLNE